MKTVNSTKKIRCPYCKTSYLPCEIFYPKDYIGLDEYTPGDFDKDVFFDDVWENSKVTEEEYVCDHCGHTFKVTAKHKFSVAKCPEHDWNYDYVTKIGEKKHGNKSSRK